MDKKDIQFFLHQELESLREKLNSNICTPGDNFLWNYQEIYHKGVGDIEAPLKIIIDSLREDINIIVEKEIR